MRDQLGPPIVGPFWILIGNSGNMCGISSEIFIPPINGTVFLQKRGRTRSPVGQKLVRPLNRVYQRYINANLLLPLATFRLVFTVSLYRRTRGQNKLNNNLVRPFLFLTVSLGH